MTIYSTGARDGDPVLIQARAESEDGSIIGDFREWVEPGESYLGRTYEEWAEAPGAYEVSKDGKSAKPIIDAS